MSDQDSASSSNTPHKNKILWVEDDSFLNDIIATKAVRTHNDIVTLLRGEDVIPELARSMPDVIVLDLLLPGMNGFEVLKEVKSNELYKNIPVVIVSNLSQDSDKEKAASLGAAKYIVKAEMNISDILKEIEALLPA